MVKCGGKYWLTNTKIRKFVKVKERIRADIEDKRKRYGRLLKECRLQSLIIICTLRGLRKRDYQMTGSGVLQRQQTCVIYLKAIPTVE